MDARAFHDIIAANHPGPVNRLDPGFSHRNDAALRLALARSKKVRSYPGYLWAMRGYAASFDDGHVQFGVDRPEPLVFRWPGFLTGYDGAGRQVVMTRADDAPVPIGAELLACDGIDATRLATRQVGAFRGRWQLASQRAAHGGRLFLDGSNPFVSRPERCRFRVADQTRTISLTWRDLSNAELDRRLGDTAARASPPIAARTLADGTRWFSLSSFNGDPDGPVARALSPLIAAMLRDRAALVIAPSILLDLRGNGGGASDWSVRIARALWGDAAVDALPDTAESVDWRVSPANLAVLETYRRRFASSPDVSPEARADIARTADGMAAALKAGQVLWHADDPTANGPRPAVSPTPPLHGPVYVLTDWRCGSACLDAVDLWRALGAVQIGQETSADTLYMDLRRDALPSGIATVATPMKVYRGRPRGSNVPWMPVFRYEGDMRDTAAIERWIAHLPSISSAARR